MDRFSFEALHKQFSIWRLTNTLTWFSFVTCCMMLLIRLENLVLKFNRFMVDVPATANLLMLDSINHAKGALVFWYNWMLNLNKGKDGIKSPLQAKLEKLIVHANDFISDAIIKFLDELSIQLVQSTLIFVLFSWWCLD